MLFLHSIRCLQAQKQSGLFCSEEDSLNLTDNDSIMVSYRGEKSAFLAIETCTNTLNISLTRKSLTSNEPLRGIKIFYQGIPSNKLHLRSIEKTLHLLMPSVRNAKTVQFRLPQCLQTAHNINTSNQHGA
jgi:hypothetical protein